MSTKKIPRWVVPVELSAEEERIAKALKRIGKLFVFLREIRSELFDEEFQQRLGRAYKAPRGTAPKPPALLAMVTLLQAYTQAGDADAVVTAQMDKRWQLVLGTLGESGAPFSQGVLVTFRERMAEHNLDQALLDRTVELAKQSGKFGWQKLKATLDSSPLLGAGRVEDTWNLIGRALAMVVDCAAKALKTPREQILTEARLTLLSGPSLKSALNINWDDAEQRQEALDRLLSEVDSLQAWVSTNAAAEAEKPPLRDALRALRRVLEQDLEPDPTTGKRKIRRGVAKDRMPSLGDGEMRHGRKSKAKAFTGYKRHFMKLVEPNVIVGAMVLPANRAEHVALEPLIEDAKRHADIAECLMDRGYLGSTILETLRKDTVVRCKPWPLRNRGLFTKADFQIRLDDKTVVCPAGVVGSIRAASRTVRFPTSTCAACAKRHQCTTAKRAGRSLTIHPQEALLLELRAAANTNEGRAVLRQRVTVEHMLARVSHVQGIKARYKGQRKNTLDARRTAALINLQRLARLRAAA